MRSTVGGHRPITIPTVRFQLFDLEDGRGWNYIASIHLLEKLYHIAGKYYSISLLPPRVLRAQAHNHKVWYEFCASASGSP